jgi:hypothetical protein
MRLDHIVIHVDNEIQNLTEMKQALNAQGYPFDPGQGKRNSNFCASPIHIGCEYIELVRMKRPRAKTWMPYWVEKYKNGQRGAFCIFIEIEDVERTAVAIKKAGIKAYGPTVLTYPGLFGLGHAESPYFIYYLPDFPGSTLQIALMQYRKKGGREAFQARMLPNAIENGIHGIRRVEVALPNLEESLDMLHKVFPDLQDENGIWAAQVDKARFWFSQSADEETHIRLSTVTSQRGYVGNKSQIHNVELVTLGG